MSNRPGARKRRAKGWRKKGAERRRLRAQERLAPGYVPGTHSRVVGGSGSKP